MLNYYGLSKDEAIAFGDGRNDIEMLEAVGTGVAMGNAIDEVKARADVICKSVGRRRSVSLLSGAKNSLNVDGLIIQQGCRVLYTLQPC